MNTTALIILRRFTFQLFVTLLFYFFLKIEFILYNWSTWYATYPTSTLLLSVFNGLRFDWAAITTISSFIFVAALIPWPFVNLNLKDQTLRFTFFLLHTPFLVFNALDIELIHFTGRRFTTDSFYLTQEVSGKFLAFISTYWDLIFINGLILFLFYRSIVKLNFPISIPISISWTRHFSFLNSKNSSKVFFQKISGQIFISLFGLILMIISIRGGLQLKPLSLAHIDTTDSKIGHLISNSSFTLLHSVQKQRLTPKNYFTDQAELIKYLQPQNPSSALALANSYQLQNQNQDSQSHTRIDYQSEHKLPWSKPPKNVVLFILESFGSEYIGRNSSDPTEKSFTPFLDSLIEKSLYYKFAFANGKRSIEALPSILAGIPALMDEPFLSSQYQTLNIPNLGGLLKQQNVNSYFFHGGKNGTMFFDEWIKRIEFTKYYGMNEYNNSQDFDGTWGIWDEPFMQFMNLELSKQTQPFLSVFFSLSSHHPFAVPDKYKSQFEEGPLPILKSISYTDYALKIFFEEAKKSKWFEETLFIITADHTSKSFKNLTSPLSQFHVPILFYFPGSETTKINLNPHWMADSQETPIQHIDLFPTILELFNIDSNKYSPPLAHGIFNNNRIQTQSDSGRPITLYLDGDYWVLNKNKALFKGKNNTTTFFDYKKELYPRDYLLEVDSQKTLKTNPIQEEQLLDLSLKATIQYFNNGLIQNNYFKHSSH